MASVLNQPFFQNEEAAYAKLENIVWPNGPVCPHCGSTDRMKKMNGAATRPGLHKCYACRKQSRVTVGTVFESSHVPVHMWLQAMYLLCNGKLNHVQFEIHGRSAWLGEGRFPYDGFPERPCSDWCYELIMNAGDRRWRTGAVWP